MQIIICRHTQTDDNQRGIYTGQLDTNLNRTGERQMQQLARRIATQSGPPIGAILSSDLTRTKRLAEAISQALQKEGKAAIKPVFTPALREVNVGRMQGLTKAAAVLKFPEEHHRTGNRRFDFRDIGGEHAEYVAQRYIAFLNQQVRQLAACGVERIVVVGHGTSLRVVFRDTLGHITHLHEQGNFQLVRW